MITLEKGDVEEIIPADQADKTYIVEVIGNPIRIGHTQRYAKDGSKLEHGTNHKVGNLRSQRLFAAAVDGSAQLRINRAAADVDSQPTRDVTVVDGDVTISGSTDLDIEDRTAREIGKARMQDASGALIDPATEQTLSAQLPREIGQWSAGELDVVVQEPVTASLESFSFELFGGNETLPSNAVPAGVKVVVQSDPNNMENVFIGSPTDPSVAISPFGAFTVDVSNTDQIGIEGTAGDSVNVVYETQ